MNIHVKLFRILASGSNVVSKISYLEDLCNFERGHPGEHSCEVI